MNMRGGRGMSGGRGWGMMGMFGGRDISDILDIRFCIFYFSFVIIDYKSNFEISYLHKIIRIEKHKNHVPHPKCLV